MLPQNIQGIIYLKLFSEESLRLHNVCDFRFEGDVQDDLQDGQHK